MANEGFQEKREKAAALEDCLILSLGETPRHGYGIKLDVEARTGGQIKLGSGTLYEAIQRLQGNGWISETDAPNPEDAQEGKRFYCLTGEGSIILRRELEKLDDIVRHARGIDLLTG